MRDLIKGYAAEKLTTAAVIIVGLQFLTGSVVDLALGGVLVGLVFAGSKMGKL